MRGRLRGTVDFLVFSGRIVDRTESDWTWNIGSASRNRPRGPAQPGRDLSDQPLPGDVTFQPPFSWENQPEYPFVGVIHH